MLPDSARPHVTVVGSNDAAQVVMKNPNCKRVIGERSNRSPGGHIIGANTFSTMEYYDRRFSVSGGPPPGAAYYRSASRGTVRPFSMNAERFFAILPGEMMAE
jgi:hypothetical protein